MKKYDTLSGSSHGAIAASTLSVGFPYEKTHKFYRDFPGDDAMISQSKWEKGSWWYKLREFLGMRSHITGVYPEWVKFFRSKFDWSDMVRAKKVCIGFCLRSEIGRLVGTPRCSFLDYIAMLKGVSRRISFKEYINTVGMYYIIKHAGYGKRIEDGVYKADPETGELHQVWNGVIPMGDAILASFANPLLGDWEIKFGGKWHNCMDGGVGDNHGVLPFVGTDMKFAQMTCSKKVPSKDYENERFVLSAYNYNFAKPEFTWHLTPYTQKLAFFEMHNDIVDREFDGTGVERYGYNPISLNFVDNLAICGGAADGLGYSTLYRTSSDL